MYFDKTGNEWENRHKFEKKPGKFVPIEIDYGADDQMDVEIDFVSVYVVDILIV